MVGLGAFRLQALLEAGLSLFYPNVCQICGAERAGRLEGYACPSCRKRIEFVAPPYCSRCGLPVEGAVTNEFVCGQCHETERFFETARSAVVFASPMMDVIHRYKYGHALYFEPLLAGLLLQQAAPVLNRADWDWIVPVPLHPVKQREREFNQAERLARHLSRATRIPINKKLIERVAPTRSQTTLDRKQRAENVKNAFAFRKRAPRLNGERIVLIDDVLTTCATTNACARVLRKNGAVRICVWTLARGR